MGTTDQTDHITFSIKHEKLDQGSVEEIATFGRLSVKANGRTMTKGVTRYSKELQSGPYVAGIYLAQWFVQNWWRLLYESRHDIDEIETSMGWDYAHWMSAIGEGYVWPNIRFESDGRRATITSVPSEDMQSFGYIGGSRVECVSVESLKDAMTKLIAQVVEQLENAHCTESSLHGDWVRLQDEINSEEQATKHRMAAAFGND